MIIEMTRVRLIGPRPRLAATVRALQDLGVVHLVEPPCPPGAARHAPDATSRRRRRHLEHALADVEASLEMLAAAGAPVADVAGGEPPAEGRAACRAARVRARLDRLGARRRALADERDALRTYEPLFAELEALFAADRARRTFSVYLLLLRRGAPGQLDDLRAALDRVLDHEHDLRAHLLPGGETIVLLLVPAARTDEIDRFLAEARVERAPAPPGLGGHSLDDALPRMRARLAEVERELTAVDADAAELARAQGELLARARRAFHDGLIDLDAEATALDTPRAFVLEGWLPARERAAMSAAVGRALGPEVSVREVGRAEWRGEDAPVVLSNPPVFRPFETLTSMLPLPRYGTVDPTPFVAVFFPMLFGVIVGDIGYGLVLAALALVLHLATKPRTIGRSISRIAAAVSIFSIIFGALYGELFGDLGARAFGLRPLWFDRREAVLPFLMLAIAIGLVHLLLGLVVAAVNRWRSHRREAIGRGLTAVMLVLTAVALLAVFERLPSALFTPAVIAILVAFPIVVALEGFTALLDLVSIAGHVLSYARVMALGTASVMLAVVANRMHGAFGSVAIGVVFALLFHLINFAITLFSPTIQVLRLHYVEFFETFFVPGGGPYRPLAHWTPTPSPATGR